MSTNLELLFVHTIDSEKHLTACNRRYYVNRGLYIIRNGGEKRKGSNIIATYMSLENL